MTKLKDGFWKDKGILSDSYVLLAGGGHHKIGNASGDIPLSNGTLCVDLNADTLDGVHASGLFTEFSNQTGPKTRIIIGGTTRDLAINADQLDGKHLNELFTDFSGGGISSSGNVMSQANHSITIGGVTKTAGSSTANIINSLSVSTLTSNSTTNLTVGITVNGVVSANKTLTDLYARDSDKLDGKHASELFTEFSNQTGPKTRIIIGGTTKDLAINADQLDGYHETAFQRAVTSTRRDFPNGTFIETDINYNVTNGDPFYMEIKGNVYGRQFSCFTQVQGYIYNNTIINYGVSHIGINPITDIVAMMVNNHLCFWFPRQSYWEGYSIFCSTAYDYRVNRIISVTDSTKPSGTKEVNLSANTHYNINTQNGWWANQRIQNGSSTGTTPQFGKVMINTTSTTYQLNISGDSYATGWSRAGNGFYCEGQGVHFTSQGSVGAIQMTSNNEFVWASSASTLYFNYRATNRGTTVTNYVWNAGSSSTYADHNIGKLHVRPTSGSYSYNEGIRIHSASNGWTSLVLCGTDLTGDSGTSANSWSMHTYGGNFYLNKQGSSDAKTTRMWGHGNGYTFGAATRQSANVTVTTWLEVTGSTNATMSSGTTNPRITFSENGGQAVGLVYTDYDSYRTSKGLKVMDVDGSDAGNVWLEVQGKTYGPGFVHTSYNSATYLLRSDGGAAAFNWSGQSGQPTWLWGGNSQHNYYVYNPSNFSVNYANSSGNADTVDGYHANRFAFTYNSANYTNSSGVTVNDLVTNGVSNASHGMIYHATDNPVGGSNWVHVWSQQWTIGTTSSWVSQIALGVQQGTGMWYRTTSGNIVGRGWTRVLDSSNYTTYVNNYYWANIKVSTTSQTNTTPQFGALYVINDSSNNGYDGLGYFRAYTNNDWGLIVDKSTSYTYGIDIRAGGEYALRVNNGKTRLVGATIIGADASPGYTLDVRGTTRSTGRIYANEWIEFSQAYTGLYWPNGNNASHFHPNDATTYGNFVLRGSRGGYSGIQFGRSTNYMTIMDNATDKGLYQEGQRWILYYSRSTGNISVRSSGALGYNINLYGSVGTDSHMYSYGFHHLSHNNDDAVLLAGGGWEYKSNYYRNLGGGNYITITVGGDANTYYPVVIGSPSDYYPYQFVNITRHYSETAPDTWNTSTHKGGLSMAIFWNGSSYWDGNASGSEAFVVRLYQSYCTMVGGVDNSTAGKVVWLRGGGANYHIFSMNGRSQSATVYLSTYTDSASRSFAPRTTPVTPTVQWPGDVQNGAGYLRDRSNGTATYANYGAAGLGLGSITWLTCWNGYELRAISKGELGGLTNVYQHTGNNVNYPLVWSNQNNTSTVQANQLHKSYSDLVYNPYYKTIKTAGGYIMGNASGYFIYRDFLGGSNLEAGFYFHSSGRESVVFANQYAHTGWIFVNGIKPSNRTQWNTLGVTPAVQIHHNALYINRAVRDADTSDYNLYVTGSQRIQSGSLHIFPTGGNYNDGIRLHARSSDNAWAAITFCHTDNAGDTGISANSWFLGNYSGNFYLNRGTSNGQQASRFWARQNGSGFTIGNIDWSSYTLEVGDTLRVQNGIVLGGYATWGAHYITGAGGRIYFGGNFHIDGYGRASNYHIYLNHYVSTNVYMVTGGGKVGINTADPQTKLDIRGVDKVSMSMDSANSYRFATSFKGQLHLAHASHGSGTGLNDGYIDGITFGVGSASYAGIFVQNSGSYGSKIIFSTTDDYSYNKARMIINHSGYVGIGTMTPGYKLDVNGTGRFVSRLYVNEWIEFSQAYTGLYWPNGNNASHFHPNDATTYGNFVLRGSRGGYSGITMGRSANYMTIMDNGTDKGLYNETNGRWIIYYNRSNNRVSLYESSVDLGYGVQINNRTGIKINSYPSLHLYRTDAGETSQYFSNNTAGWAIGINPWGVGAGVFAIGQYSGTGSSTWRFKIDNNGYCYTNSYLNLGAGNEKNASNPPYVLGFNGSDTYIRSYQTGYLNVNYANYSGWSNWSHYLAPHYDGGDKPNPQTYFNQDIGVKVAMTRNTSLGGTSMWADTLWINGYTGSDVPNMCALTFARNASPRFFISTQSNRATSYGTYYEVATKYNTYKSSGYGYLFNDPINKLYPIASNPDNSHPGYGCQIFYSWNTGNTNSSSSGWSNGITIGSHPSDQAYGFQIVQNMWDDKLYFRRYNGGWQSWRTCYDNVYHPNADYATSAGNADTVDGYHNTSFEGYYSTIIDTTSLDANTWYPVTMEIGCALQTRIKIEGRTNTNRAWNTRSDGLMALMLDYTVQGSSWGWISPFRTIYLSQHGAGATGSPNLGNIGQLTNSSTEYIFVRGGAKYNFYLSRPITPVLRSSSYTISSQTVAPTTTAPSSINRTNALISDIGVFGNLPAMYWANLRVQTSSRTDTSPTVSTIYASNWFRSTGATGWYSESYGGGIYMTDSTWVRTYGGKAFYTSSGQIRSDGSVAGGNILLTSNWIGFYSGVGGSGTRYGYIQTDASYMYFRKENGNNGFNFNGNLVPSGNCGVNIGTNALSWNRTFTRYLDTRHLDATAEYTGDMTLYIGYGAVTPTQTINFYYSTGTRNSGATSRTHYAQLNSNGLYALTRFGVNGQDTSYNFYVNGTGYLTGKTIISGQIIVPEVGSSTLISSYGLRSDYTSVGYPTEDFLKAWCKWAYNQSGVPGRTVHSNISPNSRGYIIADVYGSGINSTTGLPEHITGRYYPHGGTEIYFGTSYGNWYYNSVSVDGHTHDGRYLRKDTNDSTPYQYLFSKTNDHAIQIGTIRGYVVGSQTGNYLHIYERVHIGSPNGWGSRNAPSYGLSTYGGAWLATDTGNVGIGTTSPSYKLHVAGSEYVTDYMGIGNTPNSSHGRLVFPENNIAIGFRPNNNAYKTSIQYMTTGNEALVFSTQQAVTSFIFKCGHAASNGSDWQSGVIGTPSVQIKQQSLYVNGYIANGANAAYNLYVGGTAYISGQHYAAGYHHNSVNSNSYAISAGGGYKPYSNGSDPYIVTAVSQAVRIYVMPESSYPASPDANTLYVLT